MIISPARKAAFDILMQIENERAFSSALLPVYEEKLGELDRGLCHELTLGVLRRQLLLDRWLESLSAGKKLDNAVRISIRLGLYQLYFLRIPDHSAINESVNLTARAKKTSAKGFVNAILRRASREKPQLEFTDVADRLSIETSHPRWLIDKWIADLGAVEAADLAGANNVPPKIAFRPTARLRSAVPESKASEFVKECYIAERMSLELQELAARDEIYFQDEGSQMVAQAVIAAHGRRVLDVCASPGSKTTNVAIGLQGTGAFLVAGDVNTTRVRFLRDNCRRQGVPNVAVLQYDARACLPLAAGEFDVVLVDAPCSGTGTIRHNPELRYFLDPKDLGDLSAKQLKILENASKAVRAGGTLIYSTCSLEKEENEEVCRAFLQTVGGFEKIVPRVPERFRTAEDFARTFPHRDGMDGFFVAAFRRM